jgi:uncharacterized protein YkwD
MNMKKFLILLSCALSVVLFLSCHLSTCVAYAEEDKESVPIEQIESTKPAESVESAEPTEQTEQGETIGETADTADVQPGESQSVEDSQAKTASGENIEAARKPLVIDGLVLTESERRVFELTNAERQKRGLPALRLDRRLMESARRQANWMARTGIFRHGNSGFAENIAMGQRSGREAVVAWMNSSGHFRNMMNRGHGAIGIGSYRGPNGALFWCQQFSR